MFYRQAELLATESILTAGVKTIDINVQDVITRLSIILELTNNGIVPTNHPLAAIKSIEVVDGSDVIASMSGYAVQAMAYYNTGKMPHNELNYEDNAICRSYIPLDFGRYLYDAELGLDPKKFKNLQLRIDHNYALGGSSPDAAFIRVLADMFDEKPASPTGYLQNKEIFSYYPALNATEYIELPLDNNIRKLLVINTNNSEEPDIIFSSVKVDEEDGKRVVVDCLTIDLIRAASQVYGRFGEYLSARIDAAGDRSVYLSACKDIMMPSLSDTAAGTVIYIWSGGRLRALTLGAACFLNGEVTGRCPHGAVPVLFGDQRDLADWWDVTKVGKARLILPTGAINAAEIAAPTGTTDVIVQSLQRY